MHPQGQVRGPVPLSYLWCDYHYLWCDYHELALKDYEQFNSLSTPDKRYPDHPGAHLLDVHDD
jgi:hypothetical protein